MRLKPEVALAPFVGLVLITHAAKRERGRNRVERGLGNRDLDHAAPRLIGTTFESVPPVRNCLFMTPGPRQRRQRVPGLAPECRDQCQLHASTCRFVSGLTR